MYEECFNDQDINFSMLFFESNMLGNNLIYVEYMIKQKIEEK